MVDRESPRARPAFCLSLAMAAIMVAWTSSLVLAEAPSHAPDDHSPANRAEADMVKLAQNSNNMGLWMLGINVGVLLLTVLLYVLGRRQLCLARTMNQATKEMLAFYVEPNVVLLEDGETRPLDRNLCTTVTWKNSSPLAIHLERQGIEVSWRPRQGFETLGQAFEIVMPGDFKVDGCRIVMSGYDRDWPQDVQSWILFTVQLRLKQGVDRNQILQLIDDRDVPVACVLLTIRFLYRGVEATRTARVDCIISSEAIQAGK